MPKGDVIRGEVITPTRELRFFTYNQNNSGGSFAYDAGRGISHYVIVQARSEEDANNRSRSIGLYFDGCESGRDCSCCGDRWYEKWSEPGDIEPSIYGEPIESHDFYYPYSKWIDGYEAFVHYYDGRIVGFGASRPPEVESADLKAIER